MAQYFYENDAALLKDCNKLQPEYQAKLYKYIKKLLQLQRMEYNLNGEIHTVEWKNKSKTKKKKGIRCSFCERHQDEVERMIAAPDGAYICDECIEVCAEILEDVRAGRDISEYEKDE